MLADLLPAGVACAQTHEDRAGVKLYPSEMRSLGDAVQQRRAEYMTARSLIRDAFAVLGEPEVAVPNGDHGEPIWPAGIVGSITHCTGFRACAVAHDVRFRALGIDAEPDLPLPQSVWEEVAFGSEREWPPDAGRSEESAASRSEPRQPLPPNARRLLFCIKEAIYKTWFPLTGTWLGFDDVEVAPPTSDGRFTAALRVTPPLVDGVPQHAFSGRWGGSRGVIYAAIAVPASPARAAR